ncbi:hypothetical protein PG984_009306 [Apiospora sp. TS-2023a]
MSTLLYLSAVLSVVLYVVYLRLLPRPLPGIPYHKHSAQRLFGDLPDYVASYRKHGEFYQYRHESVKRLGFPMYQFFMTPLSRPLIVLENPREVEDICLRRNREFDRAPLTSNILGTVMPHSSIVKKTGAAWRAQRKPWLGVMAPDFLRRVVGPSLHEAAMELVELWRVKAAAASLANDKTDSGIVDILNDFDTAALDAIWVAILGEKLNGLKDQINAICSTEESTTNANAEKQETKGDAGGEKANSIDMQNTMRYMNHAALSYRTFKFPPLRDLAADTKLRDSLEAAFTVLQTGQLPTVEAILDADIPYLYAAMEETLRLSTITTVARQAVVDTEILGCKIPKGTQIATQSLLYERPVAVPEELRSETSRAVHSEKRTRGGYDGPAGDNLQDFKEGQMVFDAYALPRTAFGDGPRGCFGRRLAMHELKIMMTLTTLCFKFAILPEHLDNMRASETLFRKPVGCYANLKVLR